MDCTTHVKTRIASERTSTAPTFSSTAIRRGHSCWRSTTLGLAAITAITLFSFSTRLTAEPLPNGREVLRMARATEATQNRDLTGRLRMSTEDANVAIPFRLTMRGSTITYQFSNPDEALVLHLGEKGSRLERVSGSGKNQTVTGAKLDTPIRGTDITYEDLALRFLYWNDAKTAGEDNVGTRRCWLVQAVPASKDDSQYDMVRLWVDKSGGLLKAECYAHGKLVKSFKVTNVQHSDGGGYILKTLRVQKTGKETPTYLEINPT